MLMTTEFVKLRCRDCCALAGAKSWVVLPRACKAARGYAWLRPSGAGRFRGLCVNSIVTINNFRTIPTNFRELYTSVANAISPMICSIIIGM